MTRDLSGGTRQKLNLALALLTDPTVLLLDEPYQGFDRGTYVNFWDHCETWRRAGKSVVVVTHMLAELERVDRVIELPVPIRRARITGPGDGNDVMKSLRRVLIMAEMHGRDLTRRHIALGLLVALPLSFYLSSSRHSSQALSAGGIGMAFAVSGATLFSVLSSQNVDQRLVLGGYRPIELLLGRLLFLGPLGLVIAAGFSALMSLLSQPQQPWVLVLGVALVALQSVPFGLAVGSALSRELEGTLVLIGVVGMQLAVGPDAVVAKVLPFYGPRRLIETASHHHGAIVGPVIQTAIYGAALLLVARLFMNRRIAIQRHPVTASPPVDPVD